MNKCEKCKKEIEFSGLVWTPDYGPLRDFHLYFDTVDCVNAYKEEYSKYVEDMVGYESQNTNIV